MSQIQIRPLAENDLIEIWSYLSQHSISTANKIISRFDQKFKMLAENPQMGRNRVELSIQDLRSFPLGSYVIFYLPLSEGIEVVRVLHNRRDVESIINKP